MKVSRKKKITTLYISLTRILIPYEHHFHWPVLHLYSFGYSTQHLPVVFAKTQDRSEWKISSKAPRELISARVQSNYRRWIYIDSVTGRYSINTMHREWKSFGDPAKINDLAAEREKNARTCSCVDVGAFTRPRDRKTIPYKFAGEETLSYSRRTLSRDADTNEPCFVFEPERLISITRFDWKGLYIRMTCGWLISSLCKVMPSRRPRRENAASRFPMLAARKSPRKSM